MKWNISFRLLPDEEVVDQPQESRKLVGYQAMYTPILTNKRALFKFNSLTTNLVQGFSYEEITNAQIASRLLIKYLRLSTADGREYYFNVDNPDRWAEKILASKEHYQSPGAAARPKAKKYSLSELLAMLETLKEYGLLTEEEFESKKKQIF